MELKPCPFCGGEADWSLSDDGYFIIGCDAPECFGWIYESSRSFGDLEYGIQLWNRRADDV